MALTFFAFLGFGVITFTAKDLADPRRQLPRAMFLALGIATVIYVAVALGVFGTLTVGEVIESGGTALAVAAEPTLGRAGYWMMTVTALFATAGATNAGLYPAAGLCEEMAANGQFPPAMGTRLAERVPAGLVVTAVAAALLAVFFDLSAIASIGSVVALVVFSLITVGHVRVRHETGANVAVLAVAIVSTVAVLVAFVFTTLVDEPATAVTLVVITLGCIVVDAVWKSRAPVRRSVGAARWRVVSQSLRPRSRQMRGSGGRSASRSQERVTAAEVSSCVPASTPVATAKIEATVAASWSVPMAVTSPAYCVIPIRPSAPGTSSQKPGRNDARAGIADGLAGHEVGDRRHDCRTDEGAHVPAEDDVAEHLRGPRRVHDDEQREERPARRGVRECDAGGEHEHAEPRRPVAELVAAPAEHPYRRHADRFDAGEDPERQQGELHGARDQPARAGHHLPGGELDDGCRQRRAR